MAMGWDIAEQEFIRRTVVHDRYGGGRQGGIAPSRQSPNVLIFSDPDVGEGHGYVDRWEAGVFHYVGEGQRGDQEMMRGNRAILRHREDGKALRVFWGVGGEVQYAGEFEIDLDDPWYRAQAKETGSDRQRSVITFRLRPMGDLGTGRSRAGRERVFVSTEHPFSTPYRLANTSVSAIARDPFAVDPDAVDRGLIGHASTQNELAALVRSAGLQPLSPGALDPDFDLAWWRRDGTLVIAEIKSLHDGNEVPQLRLGLGQVLDYENRARSAGEVVSAVLAVERAPRDYRWVELCRSHGVQLVWPGTLERAV